MKGNIIDFSKVYKLQFIKAIYYYKISVVQDLKKIPYQYKAGHLIV